MDETLKKLQTLLDRIDMTNEVIRGLDRGLNAHDVRISRLEAKLEMKVESIEEILMRRLKGVSRD